MVKKSCSTCVFWSISNSQAGYGICDLISSGYRSSTIELLIIKDTDEHEINVYVETHESFYCSEFLEK